MIEHLDVLIVGAGISGISAAWHLQDRSPSKTYAILERRENMGGTWDLFKYPGIRSDSDMFTLGFRFKPWTSAKAIADGPSILSYIKDAAAENGIDKNIRYRHRVVAADWSDAENRWTVTVDTGDDEITMTCSFFFATTGYYNYDEATRRNSPPDPPTSPARSCTPPSTGRRTSTTPARRSSSSAVARPRSP